MRYILYIQHITLHWFNSINKNAVMKIKIHLKDVSLQDKNNKKNTCTEKLENSTDGIQEQILCNCLSWK